MRRIRAHLCQSKNDWLVVEFYDSVTVLFLHYCPYGTLTAQMNSNSNGLTDKQNTLEKSNRQNVELNAMIWMNELMNKERSLCVKQFFFVLRAIAHQTHSTIKYGKQFD